MDARAWGVVDAHAWGARADGADVPRLHRAQPLAHPRVLELLPGVEREDGGHEALRLEVVQVHVPLDDRLRELDPLVGVEGGVHQRARPGDAVGFIS